MPQREDSRNDWLNCEGLIGFFLLTTVGGVFGRSAIDSSSGPEKDKNKS